MNINNGEIIKYHAYGNTPMSVIYFETNVGSASIELETPLTFLDIILNTGLNADSRNDGMNTHIYDSINLFTVEQSLCSLLIVIVIFVVNLLKFF